MLIHFLQTDEPKKQKIFIEDVFKTDKKKIVVIKYFFIAK